MSLKLSDVDWSNLWQEEQAADSVHPTTLPSGGLMQQFYRLTGNLGQGSEQCIPLRNGLHLELCDYELWDDVTIESQHEYDTYPHHLCISFVVAGTVKTIHHGLTNSVLETPGKNHLEFVHAGRETEEWLAGDRIVKVRAGIQIETLRQMSGAAVATLPREWGFLVEEREALPFYRLEITTPEMQTVLQQILNCPYQNWTRGFYLESKVMELFVLWLAQVAQRDQYPGCDLSSEDIDRVHLAREILIQHLEYPPSLIELAHRVGLNDYKLKRGFRQLYSTTVFGYLHAERMEKARILLMNRQMTVTEIAHAVGYASLPSFSLAFRRRFGVNPRSYLA